MTHEPNVMTRNRKSLGEFGAPLSQGLPLWELRVGEFRVLYHIVEDVVLVRAIRAKPPHQTTEQVL